MFRETVITVGLISCISGRYYCLQALYPLLTMYNTPHAGYFATLLCRRPCLASARLRPSSSKIAKIFQRVVCDMHTIYLQAYLLLTSNTA